MVSFPYLTLQTRPSYDEAQFTHRPVLKLNVDNDIVPTAV